MFDYLDGVVNDIYSSSIVIDVKNIGYKVIVSNPYSYRINEDIKVYIYCHIREDEFTLYGFKTQNEREFFLKLISVKGLGPKMALPLIAGDISNVIKAIDNEDINYLKKYPKIGDKLARQIILDLKGKLVKDENTKQTDELVEVLTSLGYKNNEIKSVISNIDISLNIEAQIKQALKLLLR